MASTKREWAESDLFHEDISFDFIDKVFHTIAFCPKHIFQILTKRPKRMLEYFSQSDYCVGIEHIKNVWFGVSVEDQQTADERIPLLLQTPAAVRFLSIEPMLENILLCGFDGKTYRPWLDTKAWECLIDWVICGGESGTNARPMNPDWVRTIRDQCKGANVPFFFKQWGEWIHEDLLEPKIFLELFNKKTSKKYKQLSIPNGYSFDNYVWRGKKKAGRLLDGVEHNEFPKCP